MTRLIQPGARTGDVLIPSSKSQLHRLLICAAVGSRGVDIRCRGISDDVAATAECLTALGAGVKRTENGLRVEPIAAVPPGELTLFCRESGSSLRFLLPLAGALGAKATFVTAGRLSQRPLSPFDNVLATHGMELRRQNESLICRGKLKPGFFAVDGSVSSQFVSGLLMALPLLDSDSEIAVLGRLGSAPYVELTLGVLSGAGVEIQREDLNFFIRGNQGYTLPESCLAEGDCSSAAFFLCMGALSPGGVNVYGFPDFSFQGDRAVLELLKGFGASVELAGDRVTVKKASLKGQNIDADAVPDLIPALCALAAVAEGETRIINAGRLRYKESDRLRSVTALLHGLGADVRELGDGLVIRGKPKLSGGRVSACGDHRIAMAAALGACACENAVTVDGGECVCKSYPDFWDDFDKLKGAEL